MCVREKRRLDVMFVVVSPYNIKIKSTSHFIHRYKKKLATKERLCAFWLSTVFVTLPIGKFATGEGLEIELVLPIYPVEFIF
jgi:hypothetical protein